MIEFFPEARAELLAAAEYYELRESRLGERFLEVIDLALLRVHEMPEAWPYIDTPDSSLQARRIPLKPFRESIVYILDPTPVVVALVHSRRRPAYWWDRLHGHR